MRINACFYLQGRFCPKRSQAISVTSKSAGSHLGLRDPDGFGKRNLLVDSLSMRTNMAKGQRRLSTPGYAANSLLTQVALSSPEQSILLNPSDFLYKPVTFLLLFAVFQPFRNIFKKWPSHLTPGGGLVFWRSDFWEVDIFSCCAANIWLPATSSSLLCYFRRHHNGQNQPHPAL